MSMTTFYYILLKDNYNYTLSNEQTSLLHAVRILFYRTDYSSHILSLDRI